ncbi:MAG TPA: hypothetical protein VFS52_06005 [Steroidobacteraceae bacterium]|nr:hypothetical protein [Steroidobacteraceae bacterium]
MRAGWIVGAVLALLVGCDRHPKLKPAAPEPQQAAGEALVLLKNVVNEQNYRALGFDSVDQARAAVLGRPLAVYELRRDELVDWNGTDEKALVLRWKSAELVYPAMVGEQVKSTVSVFKEPAGYRPATFGNAQIARSLARYRQGTADFIVRVPALGMYFLGRESENEVLLTPVRSSGELPKFPPGVPVRAAELLPALAVLAKPEETAEYPR